VPFFWRSPGTLLIRITGAAAVLHEIMQAGREVIGLERVRPTSNFVLPRLDMIYASGVTISVQLKPSRHGRKMHG